jgi:hypothetical protein
LGDRLEKIAFNALPGTFSDDMWAHQYDQEPNQVECSLHRKPWTTDGPESNLYGLEPHFGCCAANFHQGWPKFAASLWMRSHDDGLVAAAYAPCDVHTVVGRTPVAISVETNYPFRDTIRIAVKPGKAIAFPLRLRVPLWAKGATIHVNGTAQPAPTTGSFAVLQRTWKPGDVVELRFPMAPISVKGFNDSVSVERGPLVFSYPIGASWVKLRDRGMTADWQVYPSSQWNYALAISEDEASSFKVEDLPLVRNPFSLTGHPVSIQMRARKLDSWRAVDGVADAVPQSPVSSSNAVETITLVPYAAAKLRITSFPRLKAETA